MAGDGEDQPGERPGQRHDRVAPAKPVRGERAGDEARGDAEDPAGRPQRAPAGRVEQGAADTTPHEHRPEVGAVPGQDEEAAGGQKREAGERDGPQPFGGGEGPLPSPVGAAAHDARDGRRHAQYEGPQPDGRRHPEPRRGPGAGAPQELRAGAPRGLGIGASAWDGGLQCRDDQGEAERIGASLDESGPHRGEQRRGGEGDEADRPAVGAAPVVEGPAGEEPERPLDQPGHGDGIDADEQDLPSEPRAQTHDGAEGRPHPGQREDHARDRVDRLVGLGEAQQGVRAEPQGVPVAHRRVPGARRSVPEARHEEQAEQPGGQGADHQSQRAGQAPDPARAVRTHRSRLTGGRGNRPDRAPA